MKIISKLLILTVLFVSQCFALDIYMPPNHPVGEPVRGSSWQYIYYEYGGLMKRCVGTTWIQYWSFGAPTVSTTSQCS